MCANTIYEEGEISFTRYWAGDSDGIQITFRGKSQEQGYGQMKFSEFEKAYLAAKADVESTSTAWWHWVGSKKGD